MPIRDYELIDVYTMVTIFHKTPPMSANDVAIMMYNTGILHQDLNSKENVVNTWCRLHLISHMKFAEYVAGNVTMYLENNWNILKRVPKVNYVAIPNF
ncbi:aminopeptidase n [Lasius niger]|uniref:Aminopeptidase n n=1 Tax=Lasius niger TaxID=67767 RepID=A0A0J7JY28_LASNI|nr:aminopeptidase n [Lasius niger]